MFVVASSLDIKRKDREGYIRLMLTVWGVIFRINKVPRELTINYVFLRMEILTYIDKWVSGLALLGVSLGLGITVSVYVI